MLMQTGSSVSVVAILMVCCLVMGVCSGCRQQQVATTPLSGTPRVYSRQVINLNSSNGSSRVVMWKFQTDDVANIDKNRQIAEQFLPEAEKHADATQSTNICIQAVQTKGGGLFSVSKVYGYVWDRGNDGSWQFHVSKANHH